MTHSPIIDQFKHSEFISAYVDSYATYNENCEKYLLYEVLTNRKDYKAQSAECAQRAHHLLTKSLG